MNISGGKGVAGRVVRGRLVIMLVLLAMLPACATTGTTSPGGVQKTPEKKQGNFRISNLAKSDVSYMADIAKEQMESMLQELMVKLYKRNPRELRKSAAPDIKARLDAIFGHRGRLVFDELEGKEEIYAMLLGLDPEYAGDRVFAIVAGLTGMVRRSYGYREEFFILDALNEQALYNAARNVEVLSWRLRVRENEQGDPMLLTNSLPDEPENLSFARLFGKMIGTQDLMAQFVASSENRTITKVVHTVGSMVFIPVP